jgi:ribosomal protein S18 acetylase RimI-like enzyme
MTDLTRLTKACKVKYLKSGEKYYYVFFLGTLESARGKGMCSRIAKHYQDVARKEGVTIWMEAATEYCRKLYERLGFETLEEVRVGVGKADKGGNACVGGEGFPIWAMVWRPETDGV